MCVPNLHANICLKRRDARNLIQTFSVHIFVLPLKHYTFMSRMATTTTTKDTGLRTNNTRNIVHIHNTHASVTSGVCAVAAGCSRQDSERAAPSRVEPSHRSPFFLIQLLLWRPLHDHGERRFCCMRYHICCTPYRIRWYSFTVLQLSARARTRMRARPAYACRVHTCTCKRPVVIHKHTLTQTRARA